MVQRRPGKVCLTIIDAVSGPSILSPNSWDPHLPAPTVRSGGFARARPVELAIFTTFIA